MRFTYDADADALYVFLAEELVSQTIEVDSLTMVDVDRLGNAVGIEVVRPNRDVPLDTLAARFALDENTIRRIEQLIHAEGRDGRFNYSGSMAGAVG